MRYVVVGAGAIGGGIGGRLASAGVETVLVARGAHLEALRSRGLELRSPAGTTMVDVPVVGSVAEAEVGAGDVVVLAVKSQDTPTALGALAAVTRDVAVVCAQNGVDNERQALRRFARVYGMCLLMPASHLEAGVVSLHDDPVPGVVDLGRYPSGVDATAEGIAADLRSAGFGALAHPAIMGRKHRKLLANLANVIDAAVGPGGRGHDLARAAVAEAEACFAAAGIEVASEAEDLARRAVLARTKVPMGNAGSPSSSWQSLARGARSLETDHLNGEVVLLGRLHGVATPVNEQLCRLADRLLADEIAPGSLTLADLGRV